MSWITIVPPLIQVLMAFHIAAPCISGGAGRVASERRRAGSISSSSVPMSVPSLRRIPSAATRKSAWRQSTPLGWPVVPPV